MRGAAARLALLAHVVAASTQPHIVLLLADDLAGTSQVKPDTTVEQIITAAGAIELAMTSSPHSHHRLCLHF